MNTVERARGYWKSILSNFIDESYLKNRHGACPICSGKDRFRWDNKNNNGTAYCNQCGAMSGMDLLIRYTGWDFKRAAQEVDKLIGNTKLKKDIINPKDKSKILNLIHNRLQKLDKGDNIENYLTGRGIKTFNKNHFRKLKDWQCREGENILGYADCMVACIVDQNNNKLGYHLTYIKDGQKIDFMTPKKVYGNIKGGCIRLGEPKKGLLAVAEGIENSLAVTQEYGYPCWSTITANGMKEFEPPKGLNHLIIIADNDESYVGQEAAYTLARRMVQKGLKVIVEVPNRAGYDFLDMMLL